MWRKELAGRLLCEREWKKWKQNKEVSDEQLLEIESNCRCDPALLEAPLRCQRCGNQQPQQFSSLPDGRKYCIECLNMGRVASGEMIYSFEGLEDFPQGNCYLQWQGKLTEGQQKIAQALVTYLVEPKPQLVWAVTGAGKTEMMYRVIAQVLSDGGRVGIASPRIDVCLELVPRLARDFNCEQQLLYGDGQQQHCDCPLTICTTHQLWRFCHYFDLLIVDEVDAFPYVNSQALHYGVHRAVKEVTGHLIFLTATPDEVLQRQVAKGEIRQHCLWRRYHGFDLPEPKIYFLWDWRRMIEQGRGRLYHYLAKFIAIEGIKLIFVPSIVLAEQLGQQLKKMYSNVLVVHAKDVERKAKVEAIRQGKCEVLVTTTILERGVTFPNCHVCIVGGDSPLFNVAALVQMSGRVGRSKDFPTGTLWWLHGGWTKAMKQARQQIRQMNRKERL